MSDCHARGKTIPANDSSSLVCLQCIRPWHGVYAEPQPTDGDPTTLRSWKCSRCISPSGDIEISHFNAIMAQFTILNSALTDCKTQINNLVSAQSQTISTCVADISDLRKENQSLNNNLKALENRVIKLESKNVPNTSESVFQESYERLKRSENIIITGVPESNNTEDDISKASEILENSRLSSWCEEYHILPESQAGFRPGRGCIDNVYTLSSVIQFHIRHKKRKLFSIFVDFKRAFDSINHALLWQKLYRSGVTSRILQIVKNLYQTAYFKVNASNGLSRSFDVTAGVLQGETLSPLLFSLFIADIETFFYGNGARGVSIDSKNEILLLLYADDLVILADSEADVGRKLKLLESYTKSNDLTVNTTKTKILIFSKGGHTTNNINFFYNNNPVISTNAYNYLGVTFTKSSLFREMSYTTIDKAKQAVGSILPILTSSKIDSWSPRIKLFESLALSVMSNCAPIWALRYTEALEKVQTTNLK
ncbi:uncharacterized protein LOC126890986 [Diabrotica virgifera virgifera]|uniref:Reverse transcriptase domain-containing protein n=1 Tax=Diabrotica virgifera virgifera TaxID=50390 RepID=A0ABM5L108_DIAVI|nr:uncharacterized protein LOC126890986 [Diabrotica virgifera virgifera]